MDMPSKSSVSFFPVDSVPAVLPSPFSSAPDGNCVHARKAAIEKGIVPRDFRGRAGLLLILRDDGRIEADYEFEPVSAREELPLEKATPDILWPLLEERELEDRSFLNGKGESKTLKEILTGIFAPFPERHDNHGKKEQLRTRARWRGFIQSAAYSPSVRLLSHYLQNKERGRLVGIAEWWSGKSPDWEMRFDGAFYPPEGGARFLFDWMLDGIGHEEKRLIAEIKPEALEILFEDEDFVVVNKPPKLASVSGGREALSAQSMLEENRGTLYVMHRLDMGTSGVLAFAKNREILREMNRAFAECRVEKCYEARLAGVIPEGEGEIELALALDWYERPKQCVLTVENGGRAARTLYRTKGEVSTESGIKTLVELYPVTGRTHQLRVHCAHAEGLGMPIDGDPFYGTDSMRNEASDRRLCLHAAKLKFVHPRTQKVIDIVAAVHFPNF